MTSVAEIIELHEEEAAVPSGEIDIVIPLSITYGERLEISVYPMFRAVAHRFMEKFGEDERKIFSAEAISWALENLEDPLSELGFEISEDSEDYFITRKIRPSIRPTEAVLIKSTDGLRNLTDYDIDAMTEYGCLLFGIIEDGRVLSVASTNAPIDDYTEIMEIGVETADGFGGRGYGRDSVLALTNELSARGITVHYEYASKNRASEALVTGLDTEIIARTYYLVGIRK